MTVFASVLLVDLQGECLLEATHSLDLLLDAGLILCNFRLYLLLLFQGLLHDGDLRFQRHDLTLSGLLVLLEI